MKKNLMALATILCCAIIPVGNIQAQDEAKSIFTVTQVEKTTYYLFGDDNTLDTPYQGEELRAGVINVNVKIEANNETGQDVVTPANLLFHLSFTDPYGRRPLLYESNDDLTRIFSLMKYSDYLTENTGCGRSICRGGQYVYRNYIPGLDYNYEETIEVKDEPSARVRYNSVNVGNDIEVKTFYNTGYPYDVNQFNGSEKATLRLFALGKNENGDTTETEVIMIEKPLRLYRPDQPLVAALDSMKLTYCDPEPGQYHLTMESNWTQEGANRDNILISVNDTVRGFAELDKQKYVAGTDTGMKLHMKLNYGYPYVKAETPEKDPTVRINTYVLTSDESKADTIQTSVKQISGANLADHPLDWEGDIDIADYIEEQEKAPMADTTLYIKVEVVFNGKAQFVKTIPFAYIAEDPSTGVRSITGDQPADDHWYGIQGTRMVGKPTQNGVYIQNHKKVIIK